MKYAYLADGTKLSAIDGAGDGFEYIGSLTFRRSGVSRQLESSAFSQGRIYREGSGQAVSYVPYFHITDHLGSVRAVIDGRDGYLVEENHYYPFGERWDYGINPTGLANRYQYNGKESQDLEFDLPTLDYGARHYSPSTARWLSPDPLAEKYYNLSPYAFCGNDPVNYVDPDGRDWYSYEKYSEKDDDQETCIVVYAWTNASSQAELDASGIKGTYLGEAVVVFKGSYNETIGKDGKLTGDDANPALVTIYGINNSEDIESYLGLSVSSDPTKYSMIQDGEYRMFHQQMATSAYAKTSLTYRICAPDGNLELNPVGGINKSNGENVMKGIFFHRTNTDGNATHSSVGCLVIDGRSWNNVEKQLGKSNNIYLKLSRE